MVGTLLALLAALGYGTGDFCGGVASRRQRPLAVVFTMQSVGLVFALIPAVVVGWGVGSTSVLVPGAIAGCLAGVGLVAFYRAMAVGVIGVVAPLTAVGGAVLPLVWGVVARGEHSRSLPGHRSFARAGCHCLGRSAASP